MYELHLRHTLTSYVYIIGYQPLNAKGVSMNRMKLNYVKFSDDKHTARLEVAHEFGGFMYIHANIPTTNAS
jgi:hypothetical protein